MSQQDPVHRLYGIYPGLVHDTADPQGRGRIRVQMQGVMGSEVLDWAEPCFPPYWRDGLVTGHSAHPDPDGSLPHDHNHELVSLTPAIGGSVWVMFIAGDPDHPVWLGTP